MLYDKLREIVGQRAREAEEITGQSGTRYRVPIILDQHQSKPQNFVSPVANHGVVARSVAMFFDLNGLYSGVERDAVYDNEADVRKEDRVLLKSVGTEVFTITEAPLHFAQVVGHG